MTTTPSMPRILVGTALRRYRELLGYALDEPARVLECHRSKISRIETGQRGIRPKELRELLSEYGAGESEQATLSAIASPRSRCRGWWDEYTDIIPADYQDYLNVETIASDISMYDTQRIPDLLRVEGYIRAAAEASPHRQEPGALDRRVQISLARQRAVIGDQRTPLGVVIGEAALRQVIGDTDVMRTQLRWLAEVSDAYPWVTVQVMPFDGGQHDGGCGRMTILRFPQAPNLGVVHLPGLDGGHCLVDPGSVAGHVLVFAQLQASALSPGDSTRMLLKMAG